MPFVILPAVYVDALTLNAPGSVLLLNQNPQAGEDNVPKDKNIVLDISVANGFTLDTAEVFVDGLSAWTLASGFVFGFNGAGSGTSAPDANTLRVTVDPTIDFLSDATITVRAVGVSAGLTSLDETYAFFIEDTTPPQVLSAEARELNIVRVKFNEPMRMASVYASNDALNPANYVFTPLNFPAVTAVASSVSPVSTTEVEITTDIDLTHTINYAVTVTNSEDVAGNEIQSPTNFANFVSFKPDTPAGRRWDLWQFMPRINQDEDVTGDLKNFVGCLQDVNDLLLFDIDRFDTILDPDVAPQPFLAAMLCDLGNPFAFVDLADIDQRRLISILVPLYKQKGTCIGIENAIRFFVGVEVTCVEPIFTCMVLGVSELGVDWSLCPSTSSARYTFDIASTVVLTDTQITQIVQIVNLMKPAHTHLGRIRDLDVDTPDHVELGLSQLGVNFDLH